MNGEINQAMDKAFRLLMSAPTAEDLGRADLLIQWSKERRRQSKPVVIDMGGRHAFLDAAMMALGEADE